MEKEQVVVEEVLIEDVETVEEVTTEKPFSEVVDEYAISLEKLNVTQKELAEQQKEMFKQQIEWNLQRNGLEAFADIINPKDYDELNTVVAQLVSIMNEQKVANSYQPKDNATQDAYSVAQQKGDTKKMIGSKLANLFK